MCLSFHALYYGAVQIMWPFASGGDHDDDSDTEHRRETLTSKETNEEDGELVPELREEEFKAAADMGALKGQVEALAKELADWESARVNTEASIEEIRRMLAAQASPNQAEEAGKGKGAEPVKKPATQEEDKPPLGARPRIKSLKDDRLPELGPESSTSDFRAWKRAFKLEMFRTGIEKY